MQIFKLQLFFILVASSYQHRQTTDVTSQQKCDDQVFSALLSEAYQSRSIILLYDLQTHKNYC